jgi:predicted phosphoserine aminotransferase
MIGHRGPAIVELMEELQAGLQEVFVTDRPVLISSSSATGLMEAAVRNASSGRILSLVNGAFSGRFAKIARLCGIEVDEVPVEWGSHHDPQQLADALKGGTYDAVTVVHSETSTGALQDLAALSEVLADHPETLLLVDSVTGVGGAEMRADAWGLDFVLTGSQKALAVPPGLAFGVASEAMLERAATVPNRGMYFDLVAFADKMAKFQTPNTPAVSLMYSLKEQLRYIRDETMEKRWARHTAMAERTYAWVDEMNADGAGLAILADEGFRSPTVTCIQVPEDTTGPDVVKAMAQRDWVIGGGYGKLKPTHIRIGHMGDHTVDGLNELLADLAEVIR